MNNYSHDRDIRFQGTPARADDSPDDPWADGVAAQNLGASLARRKRCPMRSIAEVAQLYHEERCTPNKIANKLRLSQGTVGWSLKKAKERGIVPMTIPPQGILVDLEDKFGLAQAIIARVASDSEESKWVNTLIADQ